MDKKAPLLNEICRYLNFVTEMPAFAMEILQNCRENSILLPRLSRSTLIYKVLA